MTDSPPAVPMLARQNDCGISVNESAICVRCTGDQQALEASFLNWADAEDVSRPGLDEGLYPIDNPDGRCNGCAAPALFPLPGEEIAS